MPATNRFLDSTRGAILARLLREPRTVADLADEFGISGNAARVHVTGLERDGYVERWKLKHTAGKPAALYRVTPEGEALFPKAYEPVLGAVADALVTDLGPEEAADFIQQVGALIGRRHTAAPGLSLDERIDAAVEVLQRLGGVLEVKRSANGVARIEGSGCPLSGVVREHQEFCELVATMLEEISLLPVEQCCRNDRESPSCRFVIGSPGP